MAMAGEPLSFSYSPGGVEQALLRHVLPGSIDQYSFASADINGDGIDELFSVPRSCKAEAPKLCEYKVFGRGAEAFHALLSVKAWDIVVSDRVQDGVRDLLVYKNRNNQFRASAYTWNALKTQYTEGEGDNRS